MQWLNSMDRTEEERTELPEIYVGTSHYYTVKDLDPLPIVKLNSNPHLK
jgi:hypothetical protein